MKKTLTRFCFLIVLCCLFVAAKAQSAVDTLAILSQIEKADQLVQKKGDSAAVIFQNTLAESERINFANGVILSLRQLINIYVDRAWHDKGLTLLSSIEAHCIKNPKLYTVLPYVYNSRATIYQRQSKYAEASKSYYTAVFYAQKFAPSFLETVYNNIASLLIIIDEFKQALYYLDKAEAIVKKTNNNTMYTLILINKGSIYGSLHEWEKSETNLNLALAIANRYKIFRWEGLALICLGNTYYSQHMLQKAKTCLLKALAIKGDVDPVYRNSNLVLLGNLFYEIHDYDSSEYFLLKALQTAKSLNIITDLKAVNRELGALYAQKGEYTKAYKYQQDYINLIERLQEQNTNQSINQLEIKYRTAEKDKDIIQKQLKISNQESQIKEKNIWIISISAGAILLAAILTLLYILYKSNQHKQDLQEQKIQSLQQEQEIGQLKAMMKGEEKERTRIARELHDGIGGMLASISINLSGIVESNHDLSNIRKLDNVLDMLEDTTSEVRKTAHNLMPEVLMRNKLKDALLIYCTNINTNTKLQIDLHCHGDLDQLDKAIELVLYRIIQELIQNVIKHANASYADVQIMINDDLLSINVEDNGIGFDTAETGGGYGLQNLQFRVQALQGYISITSKPGKSTTIYIEFEVEKLKNQIA